MAHITVGAENSAAIKLYYEDHGPGSGQPVVLIHGFPVSSHVWEKQEPALLDAGFRVVAYDRRGYGQSDQPSVGYDYDTFAADLNTLMTALDLREAVLMGFSMGTGEVVRYLATYGAERVSRAILLAPLPPFLLRTVDNPDGIRGSEFDGILKALVADRPAYLQAYLNDCFNVDALGGVRISEPAMRLSWNIAVGASAKATHDSVAAWTTDFRQDVPKIDVPVLIVQGDQDRILPIRATGLRLSTLLKNVQFVLIEGGPHAIGWTHAEEVNAAVLDFLGR